MNSSEKKTTNTIAENSRNLEEEPVKKQNYRCLFGSEEDSVGRSSPSSAHTDMPQGEMTSLQPRQVLVLLLTLPTKSAVTVVL